MCVLLFEDSLVERLHPITLCRPAFAIHCGGLRLIDIVSQIGPSVAALSRVHLNDSQELDFPNLTPRAAEQRRVLINARLVPDTEMLPILAQVLQEQNTGAVWIDGQLALAILPNSNPLPDSVSGPGVPSFVRESQLPDLVIPDDAREHFTLLEYPYSVIAKHGRVFTQNLEFRSTEEGFQEVSAGVYAQDDVSLGQYVVTDTSRGPILLESGVVVGPFSYLAGPLLVRENGTIHAQSTIHPYVSVGSTVKLGGEVECSIIESYSNKQHDGYLGHSYLGSWVNLGAGTSNSNLKNTYGQVNMTVAGQKLSTGMRLMGCVIGDYTKTAINTSILTGRTIGVASMLYGFVAQDVPSFVNYAHQFGDISAVSFQSAAITQQRMFARRHVPYRGCDEQLLAQVFELTAAEREALPIRPPKLA